jgi:iron complex outermembrane receptor protein
MKINLFAFIVLGAFSIQTLQADDIQEVVVTSSILNKANSQTANPTHVVSGEDIVTEATQSLGETLDDLLGVSSADYGSAVGQPIIRGMSGPRVKILDNGIVNRDVSGLGADHFNDIDLGNAQQIEVVRGPSSLLYTNGTVGGIINFVDNSIAQENVERLVKIGGETQSVNDGDTQSLFFQDNVNEINVSFAYKNTSLGNYDVPNGAIVHEEEEHHDEEEDHEEHEEDLSFLAYSDFESESMKFGASKVTDKGYIGFSVSNIESTYGIPFHGEGHEDEHGEEHGEEHSEEEGHDEHEGERIFTTSESDKFNLRGSYNLDGWKSAKSIDFFFNDSDYTFTEQHAEEEEHEEEDHDEDEHEGHEGHEEGPTTFTNDAVEAGFIFDLSNDFMSQKLAVNFVNEDTSVLGSEAFMNPASRDELTFGYYISRDISDYTLDFGVRFDRLANEGSISSAHEEEEHHDEDEDHEEEEHDEHEEMETAFYDKSFNNTSLAFNIGKELNDFINVDLGFASVERAPSSIELFMNGAHLATGRFEVGNVNLQSETSNNIDLTVSLNNGGFFASATLFANKVDNYIYLRDETEEEHEDHDEEHEEDHDDHGGLILSNYLQQDADLDGYEIEFGNTMDLGTGELTMSFGRDVISGTFTSGGNIPRLNPARNIFKLKYSQDDMTLGLNFKDVEKQNDIAVNETLTAGYQMLNAKLSRTIDLGSQGKLTLSLFGNNMLDEIARNHSSFVKNEVPLPGRNYGLRFNLNF